MKKVAIFLISLIIFTACSNSKKEGLENIQILPKMDIPKYEEVKAQHRGKVILVNFFASWCPPCKDEIPDFIKVYNKHSDRFVIIGVSIDDDIKKGSEFVAKEQIPYPVYHADRALEAKMNVSKIPTNILYKPDGSLFNFYIGPLSEDFLESVIETLTK